MNLIDHLKTTGGAGENIHLFMDQFYKYFGRDHRVILHHKMGIKAVGKIFGTAAMPIAENHILDDWQGGMPNGPHDKNFYRLAWAYDLHMFMDAVKFADEFLKIWG